MEISRKYAVTEKVGQGGMGVVYQVRHLTLDTTLALKVLRNEVADQDEMRTRFSREARLMARLKHPNIVRVIDIDYDEALNFHYFVMEFIEGKTLRQYIREQGAMPLAEVLHIAIQVATALTYAHTQVPSVIHRDVKPSNIMIEDQSGRVVVMDFGIAKEIGQSDATRTGTIMGTMKYCAPEQIRHESVDGAADIYALGMVIYEAYTGKQFFAGLDETAIVGKVLYESQEHIADFSPDTPPVFTAVVTKAIAKSREHRYRTAAQLLRDLEQCRAALKAGTLTRLSLPGLSYANPLSVPTTEPPETQQPGGAKEGITPAVVPSFMMDSEIDEDHWEIGEEKKTPRRLPRAKVAPARPSSRVPSALIGAGAVGVLGFALWWMGVFSLVAKSPLTVTSPVAKSDPVVTPVAPENQPPLLLSLTPPAETIELMDGVTQTFQLEARDPEGEPLVYAWTLDGKVTGTQPGFDWKARGSGNHRVRAVVTDSKGLAATREWRIAVLSPPQPSEPEKPRVVENAPPEPEKPVVENAPPRITRVDPRNSVVVAPEGTTLTFSTLASDPDGDTLVYEWSIDGKKNSHTRASASAKFRWKAQGTGNHQVRAVVGDRGGLTVSQEWQVAVLAPVESPPPLTPVEAPPPALAKNAPPEITGRVPDENAVTMVEGATVTLSATAIDPDGEELLYEWLLNGKKVASDATFPFTAESLGTWRVEVKVTDPRGGKVSTRWDIRIEARPPTPQLVMFTPHESRYTLYDHLSRFFGVEVEVPGVPEPELRYEWKINGTPVNGHELLEFKNQPIGTHRVEVAVLSAVGERVTHQWTVQVRADEADRPSIWAPRLEIVELDNTRSKDKKFVTVTGTIRNIDEERTADNVIVWVSAINAQGDTVSRRMTLPTLQPLAPGQVAPFRVAFANRDAMSDFRVEVLSK
ncbi:MAG: serine/threonine protein kinase [Deltaproteobacteria bacterium]|nr:serine/threonine protein kinase [Deltaproteobacteria bacterium]